MPNQKKKTVRVNSNLSEKNNQFLDEYSNENGMTKSALINLAVEEFREKKEAMDLFKHPKVREKLKDIGFDV